MEPIISLDHQLLAVETEHDVHMLLELQAPEPAAAQRRPLDLAVVLDRSGSMSGPKMQVARNSAAFLAQRLSADDRLAVVAFDDGVELVAPLGRVTPAVVAAIGAIDVAGTTNLSGGWLQAAQQLQGGSAAQRRILLLTDGHANVGITDPQRLTGMALQAYARGIGTTTIGLGDGFSEDLLTAMADAGGGRGYFAGSFEDTPGIFSQEFDGLVQLVAQNLAVTVRPAPSVEFVAVLNDYPAQGLGDGVLVQVGDVHAGALKRLVVRLHVPSMAALGVAHVADVVVTWAELTQAGAKLHTLTLPVTVNLVSADEATAAQPDQRVIHEVLELEAARALDEAKRLADEGDFGGAASAVSATTAALRQAAPAMPVPHELLDRADELDEMADMLHADVFDSASRKSLHYTSHDIKRGTRRPQRPRGSDGS